MSGLPETSAALERDTDGRTGWTGRKIAVRVAFLLVTLVSLYFLMPSLLEVFTSWRKLLDLEPLWILVALGFEAASFIAAWELLRVALGTRSWFAVGSAQLAGNALSRIVPGGMATAGTLQYRMLVRAGVPGGRVASAVAAVSALTFATLVALPLLSIPAIVGGTPVDRSLRQSLWLGAIVFFLMLGAGALAFAFDRPLVLTGRAFAWVLRVTRIRRNVAGLPERLLAERDTIRATFGVRWKMALSASIGKSLFDFLALVACLYAVGAKPNPSLVLLAYVAASLLGMIPITPGGLGFVEAGLTGTLALAGISGGAAVVATLAYRLVSFWAPIPLGGVAYWLFGRRYRAPA
jgi:putative heme transporter